MPPTQAELMLEVADLRVRMAEAEDILRAIREYEVDALVVRAAQGDQVLSLATAGDAYQGMVEQMPEGAATLTVDGLVLYANRHLASMLSCPVQELVGRHISDCLAPADWSRLALLLADPAGGRIGATLVVDELGRVPVSFLASRLQLDDAPVVLLLVIDLTYEKQADRVSRLLALSTRLSVAMSPAQAAEAIVNGAVQALGGSSGFVAVPSEDGSYLTTLHAVGYLPGRQRQISTLPVHVSQPVSDAIRSRDLVVVETLAERQRRYPHWPAPMAQGEMGALLAVPLLLPDRLVGVLHIGFPNARPFDTDDRDFTLTLAQQCAQVLDRASLYSELEQRVQARTLELLTANANLAEANQLLTEKIAERRLVQIQLERSREDERTRVARELHDELGSTLTGLKMAISQVVKTSTLPAPAVERLTGVLDLIDGAVESVRRLATELRPHLLDDLGLVPALESYYQDFVRRLGVSGEFVSELDDVDVSVSQEQATACFRIFQEALTNIARHAEATQVMALLSRDGDDTVLLRVTDNGRGMRLEDGVARGHLGLEGMQERANVLAGPVEILSAPGQGTTVLVRIPLGPRRAP